MALFRSAGKIIGTVTGEVIGGGVKFIGKKVESKWVEEVGEGVKNSSYNAFDNAGQFIDGAAHGTYGLITKDEYYKQKGLDDLFDSSGRTLNGIGSTLKYTGQNAGNTFKGIVNQDKGLMVQGVKGLGKVVAVSALAVGVIEFADGVDLVEADEVETRNDHLSGEIHSETGVPFVEKELHLPDGDIKGVFPVFDSNFSVELSEDVYTASDATHFEIANDTLLNSIHQDPAVAKELGFSTDDIECLERGETPEGYLWHHNEEPGVLQLVDRDIHENTGHSGGRAIWGGGEGNR